MKHWVLPGARELVLVLQGKSEEEKRLEEELKKVGPSLTGFQGFFVERFDTFPVEQRRDLCF